MVVESPFGNMVMVKGLVHPDLLFSHLALVVPCCADSTLFVLLKIPYYTLLQSIYYTILYYTMLSY